MLARPHHPAITELRKRVACRYGQSGALSSSLASVTQTRPDDDDTDGQQSSSESERGAIDAEGRKGEGLLALTPPPPLLC